MAGKAQHYLPRSYLRGFLASDSGKSKRLYEFDKRAKKSRLVALKDICQKEHFYDYKNTDGERVPVDKMVTDLEKATIDDLLAIRNNPTVETLDTHREGLGQYIAFLMARSQMFRRYHKSILEALAREQPELGLDLPSQDEVKHRHYRYMAEGAILDTAKQLRQMRWDIFESNELCFCTSDYPFVIKDADKPELHVQGNKITLPMFEAQQLQNPNALLVLPMNRRFAIIIAGKSRCTDERQIELGDARVFVESINSHLLKMADRFIFSSTDDFQLVNELLDEHPDWAKPPTITLTPERANP
jgi:hypothetical protein